MTTISARDIFYSYPKLPVDAPMPMYVPLEEYEALKVKAGNMSQDKERDIIQRDEHIFELQTENDKLLGLLRQWAEISSNLTDVDIQLMNDFVRGQSPELTKLITATNTKLGTLGNLD